MYFSVNATVTPIASSVFALPVCSEFEERDRYCEVVVGLTISVFVGDEGVKKAAEYQPATVATPDDIYRPLLLQKYPPPPPNKRINTMMIMSVVLSKVVSSSYLFATTSSG